METEAQFTSIGSSLQVPSVQELAKRPMITIPPQYVRDDQDPLIISDTSSSPDIPVIDLQGLLSSDSMNSELEKLHSACKEWGFFQLINHGISSAMVEKVKQEIEDLFNLPMEEKKSCGKSQVLRAEERELMEGGLMQALRINYYPPCPKPELVLGVTPHSDGSLLTIVLQLNQVDGLQIKKDGMWIPIRPLPSAFVVNVGDSLEILSNGIYKSIQHRAVVNSEKERISVAAFHSPKFEGELGPAPSLVTPETPALFKRVGIAEYYRRYLARKLHEKSNIEAMRIQNEEGENN
ncbi:Thebaine 6-O-demethylase [Bertholletia excelsa]